MARPPVDANVEATKIFVLAQISVLIPAEQIIENVVLAATIAITQWLELLVGPLALDAAGQAVDADAAVTQVAAYAAGQAQDICVDVDVDETLGDAIAAETLL